MSQLFILSPESAGEHAALHRQRSLPHRPPVIPLVARMADQNTSGTPAMTEREASRLDKFRQLLAGPNTDLGKARSSRRPPRLHFVCFISRGFVLLHALALLPPSVSCAALLTTQQVRKCAAICTCRLHGGEIALTNGNERPLSEPTNII